LIVGRGKNADPSFHLSIQQGQDIPLIYILGGFKVIGGTKTTIVLNPIVIDSTDEVKSLSNFLRCCNNAKRVNMTSLEIRNILKFLHRITNLQ